MKFHPKRLPVIFIMMSCALQLGCVGNESPRVEIDTGEQAELVDPCREAMKFEFGVIEDFELAIGRMWWISTDGTGAVTPLPGREPEATLIDGGRCGTSLYALNLRAADTEIYGGAFGVNFFPDPVDASGWDGISFWAKRSQNSGKTIFFSLGDKYTDQSNGASLFDDGVPYCLETPLDPADKCDRFGAGVGLDTEWKFFTIRFDQMAQRGFGKEALALDTSAIIGLNIAFETGDFNIWIDDVAFFREPPL